MEMHPAYLYLDSYLIWFYRLSGSAEVNFLLGTLALAVLSLLVGELTSFLASFLVRRRYQEVADEAKKYQNLSMEALQAGDRPAYEGANKLANEAFGKSFYSQVALSATFVWPIFFALGWMQHRFFELEFAIPFTGLSLGFIGIFILLYIPVYVIFKKTKGKLPSIRRLTAILTRYNPQEGISDRAAKTAVPGDGARKNA